MATALLIGIRASLRGAFAFDYPHYIVSADPDAVWGVLYIPIAAFVILDYFRRLLLLALWRRKARRNPTLLEEFRRRILRWRFLSACVLLQCVTLAYPWPAAVRFYVSWPWLAEAAEAHLQCRPGGDDVPQQLGLFHVDYIAGRLDGRIWLRCHYSYRGGRCGIVYVFDRNRWPACRRCERQFQVAPSWYLVHRP